jgi:hypothetical protein
MTITKSDILEARNIIKVAREQHRDRLRRLQSVYSEIEDIFLAMEETA